MPGKQGEGRRIGVNRGEVCEGEFIGCSPEDEPLTLTRCHSCRLAQVYEPLGGNLSVSEPTT